MSELAQREALGVRGAGKDETRLLATVRRVAPAVAGYALPFLLVLYLALEGGGYDAVVRGEVGIAVWWIVLVGAAIGVMPAARLSRAAWGALGLIAAFAIWAGLSIGWSESAERSSAELARLASYAGIFALALAAQGRDGLRRTLGGVAAAIAVVSLLALASRLHPAWFPADEAAAAIEEARNRLNYPLNYWNGLAALIAIGMPPIIYFAWGARHLVARALAAAVVPAMSVAIFFTLSRAGAGAFLAAAVVLVALHPRRLSLIPTVVNVGVGSVLAVAAASQREGLTDAVGSAAAAQQGDEMFAVMLVICAGVGLVQAAVGLADRYELGPRIPSPSRRATLRLTVAGLIAVTALALAAGVPGELSDRWEEFKNPTVAEDSGSARFDSASGNGRYQLWDGAFEASSTEPLTGIGAGGYELFYAREGDRPGFVRDAHSLFLETLAELGVVGLLLIGGGLLVIVATAVRRAARARPDLRPLFGAIAASTVAFTISVAVDWTWELTVVPVAFLLLAAAALGARGEGVDAEEQPAAPGPRIALIVLAIAAMVVIAIPLATTNAVRASQNAVERSQLPVALEDARTATEIQSYAATPRLQEALVLELSGDLDAAAASARRATQDEPTNWATWMVLSRLEARRGAVDESIAAYQEARRLNPRSALFQGG